MGWTVVVQEMIHKASRKEINLCMTLLTIGVFFVLIGITIAFIKYGGISVSSTAPTSEVEDRGDTPTDSQVPANEPPNIKRRPPPSAK